MYIRSKRIKGHAYYYLVRSERCGKKVTQKFIRYLGKGEGAKRAGLAEGAAQKGRPKERATLAEEARKYKSVEEFIRSVPKSRRWGFPDAREIKTSLPLEGFEYRLVSTPEYRDARVARPGRQIKNPILIEVEELYDLEHTRFGIFDGWHRFRQALANKDIEIPVCIMVKEKQLADFYSQAIEKR